MRMSCKHNMKTWLDMSHSNINWKLFEIELFPPQL
jgi:hypothetical protein